MQKPERRKLQVVYQREEPTSISLSKKYEFQIMDMLLQFCYIPLPQKQYNIHLQSLLSANCKLEVLFN